MQAISKGIELAEEAKVEAFETSENLPRERKKAMLKVEHNCR
jgi:hypothetical protein